MAKRYSVSPVLLPGRTTFTATFRAALGQRICRSLGTNDRSFADLICAGLVRLHLAGVRTISEVPSEVPLDAVRLYFGEAQFSDPNALPMDGQAVDINLAAVRSDLLAFPKQLRARLFPILLDRRRLQSDNESIRLEATAWKRSSDSEREKREELERSLLARAAQSGRNMPPLADSLSLFSEHITATTSPQNAQKHIACAADFLANLPGSAKSLADVSSDHIAAFLDQKTAQGDPEHALGRRREWRIRIARFINWGAKRWELPSPMRNVPSVPRHAVLRERGDIVWHQLADVEQIIKELPNPYWQALIATLAYAGLQLAELTWLRTTDVELLNGGKRGRIWVTTVEDPEDPQTRHMLKTSHRRRHVDMHPTLLLPRIKAMLKAGKAGKNFFFAIPEEMRRRRRGDKQPASERWMTNSLSTLLRGHPGGKKRLPVPGLLPKGMNAKSLRRTFGSLLLRSGKTSAEVAAAMGNTEDVVRQHYARLLGSEVDVNF